MMRKAGTFSVTAMRLRTCCAATGTTSARGDLGQQTRLM